MFTRAHCTYTILVNRFKVTIFRFVRKMLCSNYIIIISNVGKLFIYSKNQLWKLLRSICIFVFLIVIVNIRINQPSKNKNIMKNYVGELYTTRARQSNSIFSILIINYLLLYCTVLRVAALIFQYVFLF